MGKFSDYKKYDEITANDLDKGCRNIINQNRPSMRRLKTVLRRSARKQYTNRNRQENGDDSND